MFSVWYVSICLFAEHASVGLDAVGMIQLGGAHPVVAVAEGETVAGTEIDTHDPRPHFLQRHRKERLRHLRRQDITDAALVDQMAGMDQEMPVRLEGRREERKAVDRKSTRLNSSH